MKGKIVVVGPSAKSEEIIRFLCQGVAEVFVFENVDWLIKKVRSEHKSLGVVFLGEEVKSKVRAIKNIREVSNMAEIEVLIYGDNAEKIRKDILGSPYKDKNVSFVDLNDNKESLRETLIAKVERFRRDLRADSIAQGSRYSLAFERITKLSKSIPLDEVFKGLPLGVCVLNENLSVTGFNYAASKILRADKLYLLGSPMARFVDESERHHFMDFMNSPSVDETHLRMDVFKSAVEGISWLHFSVGAVENGSYVVVFYDYSKVKKSEFVMLEANERLDELVKERTAQLEELNKKLEESNRELEVFTYTVSHDLKEPLRGMRNLTNFVIEDFKGKIDHVAEEMLGKIVGLTEKLESFIEELLEYSKLGRTEEAFQEVDLNEVVSDILYTLEDKLNRENIKVSCARMLPRVYCDKARIGRVFLNLITNGYKYNTSKNKQVSIGWVTDCTGRTVFFVKDNGIGISEGNKDKVFGIFKRLHGEGHYGGGTGAGLAIVKKIIEKHKGDVWLESEEGKGTTFYFTLNAEIPAAVGVS